MTLNGWLASKKQPPARLAERLARSLASHLDEPPSAERLVEVAAGLLASINRERRHDRASALDLLTVDALVTYAFELAAEEGRDPHQLVAFTITRISATLPA
ncbi:MAG: hypothetical protein ACT4OZ_00555 [Gemmatimonadota bacterium]